jgi:hypothetical protein
MCRRWLAPALLRRSKLLLLHSNNPRERVAAAIALLDRGWGKPKQPLIGDGERPVAIEFTWASALDTDNEGAAPTANPVTIDAELEDVADTGSTVIVWKGRQ